MQQSSLGTVESAIVSIVAGLAVVFIPFSLKYFNSKFQSIKDTAEDAAITAAVVDKHHRDNKRRFKQINKQIALVATQQKQLLGNGHTNE